MIRGGYLHARLWPDASSLREAEELLNANKLKYMTRFEVPGGWLRLPCDLPHADEYGQRAFVGTFQELSRAHFARAWLYICAPAMPSFVCWWKTQLCDVLGKMLQMNLMREQVQPIY